VKVRQVAEELGVRYVLEGSVRRTQNKIRITAQLIDALNGNHIWAERYDRELEDVFSVQSEVARQVAKALAVTLKANENERLFQKHTMSIDAYDVFLQARRTVDAPSRDNILRGEKLFRRVIENWTRILPAVTPVYPLTTQYRCASNTAPRHPPTWHAHSNWPRRQSK
jgi:adenylate cyclase